MKFKLIENNSVVSAEVEYDTMDDLFNAEGFHLSSFPTRAMMGDKTIFPVDKEAILNLCSLIADKNKEPLAELDILKDSLGTSLLEIEAYHLYDIMSKELGEPVQYHDINGKRYFFSELDGRTYHPPYEMADKLLNLSIHPSDGRVVAREDVDILYITGSIVYCDNRAEAESVSELSSRNLVKSSIYLADAICVVAEDDPLYDTNTGMSVEEIAILSNPGTTRAIASEMDDLTMKLRAKSIESGEFEYADYRGSICGLRNDKENPLVITSIDGNVSIQSISKIESYYTPNGSNEREALIVLDKRTMNAAGAMSNTGIHIKFKNLNTGFENNLFFKAGDAFKVDTGEIVNLKNYKKPIEPEIDFDHPF